MKDDKIIRAVSDIDDRFILEADPETAKNITTRKRFSAFRVIAIAAAASIITFAGVLGGIALLQPGANSADSGKAAYNSETKAIMPAAADSEKTDGIHERSDSEFSQMTEAAEVEGAVTEEKPEGMNTEAADSVTNGGGAYGQIAELSESPDGRLLLFVRASVLDITVTEGSAKFSLLLSDGENTLYLVEPEEGLKKQEDMLYGMIHVRGVEDASDDIEIFITPELLSDEMSEKMREIYEDAEAPWCGISE